MTRYQRFTLLIMGLILVAVVALVLVTALRQPTLVVPTSMLSADDQTATWAVGFATANADQINAIGTHVMETVASP